jgi:hypothetical protein
MAFIPKTAAQTVSCANQQAVSFEQMVSEVQANPAVMKIMEVQSETALKVRAAVEDYFKNLLIVDFKASNEQGRLVAKIDTERLAKFDADDAIFSQKLTPCERECLNMIFIPLNIGIGALAKKNACMAMTYTPERARKIVLINLIPHLKEMTEKILKISPEYFIYRLSRSEKDKRTMVTYGETICGLSVKIDCLTKEERQELYIKIQPKKIDDLDKSRFSNEHLPIAEGIVQTLKDKLAQDKESGEKIIFGVLTALGQYVNHNSIQNSDSQK